MAVLRLPMEKIPVGARCRSPRCGCVYRRIAELPPEERHVDDKNHEGWWDCFEWAVCIQPCRRCQTEYETSQRTGDKRWPGKTFGSVCMAIPGDTYEVELIETIGSL